MPNNLITDLLNLEGIFVKKITLKIATLIAHKSN